MLNGYDWRDDNILTCSRCKYHNYIADTFPNENICPNMDYTRYWFYAPWFVAHCTGENNPPCKHFKPVRWSKLLYENFTTIEDYMLYQIKYGYIDVNRIKVTLFNAGNRKTVAYKIKYLDFYYGTYLHPDGTLKATEKFYYKRIADTGFNYKLVRDWIGYDTFTDHSKLGKVY